MRGVGADELEAERAKTVAAGALDGRQLRAGHPQRRMRLLHRLRHDVAQGDVEYLPWCSDPASLNIGKIAATASSNTSFLVTMSRPNGSSSVMEALSPMPNSQRPLESRSSTATATRGMVGGELENAVAEPDVLRALARRGQERFRRGRVRIFLEEVMLDDPGMVVAKLVGEFHLRECVLVELELVARTQGRGSCSS
jgi:hypothetical protein